MGGRNDTVIATWARSWIWGLDSRSPTLSTFTSQDYWPNWSPAHITFTPSRETQIAWLSCWDTCPTFGFRARWFRRVWASRPTPDFPANNSRRRMASTPPTVSMQMTLTVGAPASAVTKHVPKLNNRRNLAL